MEASDRRDLTVAAVLWPLSLVLLVIAAFAPLSGEFELSSASEASSSGWPGGLVAAATLLAIVLGIATSSIVVSLCAWSCLFLAVWVGLAFNVGSHRSGALGLAVLVALLLIARVWIAWNVARKERRKPSTTGVTVTDDKLLELHSRVEREIDLRRSSGAPSAEIGQLQSLRDEIEERLRHSM